jgi:hypothetical protein
MDSCGLGIIIITLLIFDFLIFNCCSSSSSVNTIGLRPLQSRCLLCIDNLLMCVPQMVLCAQRMVEEEDVQFEDEYVNDRDPSILHFLLAAGDEVRANFLLKVRFRALLSASYSLPYFWWSIFQLNRLLSVESCRSLFHQVRCVILGSPFLLDDIWTLLLSAVWDFIELIQSYTFMDSLSLPY